LSYYFRDVNLTGDHLNVKMIRLDGLLVSI
jgi:hypothetical protein